MHQKQPPAKIAFARFSAAEASGALNRLNKARPSKSRPAFSTICPIIFICPPLWLFFSFYQKMMNSQKKKKDTGQQHKLSALLPMIDTTSYKAITVVIAAFCDFNKK